MTMQTARIGDLIIRDGKFHGEVDGSYTQIDNVDLSNATLAGVDFTGSRIRGKFLLVKPPKWGAGAKLNLCQASAGVVQDEPEAWPQKLEVHGFTYDSFGGFGLSAALATRGSGWFVDWLGKHQPYTPQPYQQCAKVLREMGHPEMADDVLYAGRERERAQVWERGEMG
jgi:hypothetical protein